MQTNQQMMVSFSIAGGTNGVPYEILTTTNLTNQIGASEWQWLAHGYDCNTYTFSNQPSALSFYALGPLPTTMVVAWGADGAGQCNVPFGLSNIVAVAGGGGHSLALKYDGTLAAWGLNNAGQANVPTNLAGVKMITAGWYHSLALLTNGTVTAWGMHTPFDVTDLPANLTNLTVVSAQAYHSLALSNNGTVVAWGYSLGYGETTVPAGLSNVVAISAGFEHNLAAKSDGTVFAWGYNGFGQTNVPAGLSNVVDVEAGPYHSLALLNNGTVVAWGDNSEGATNVPAGLTNVIAIAAGGDPLDDTTYSMALKSDRTVVVWGDSDALDPVAGLNNVIAIAAGADHALAVRSGPPTPVIALQPVDLYQATGGSTTFTAQGEGLGAVQYQWLFDGTNISGATNATLTLTNVQAGQQGNYQVIVSNSYGSITSSIAAFALLSTPVIVSLTQPTNQAPLNQTSFNLAVSVTAPDQFDFPLSYQWKLNGTNLSGATSPNYTFMASAATTGTYSVTVTNAAGSTNASWLVNVLSPGNMVGWGADDFGQSDPPVITNASGIAAGGFHSLAVKDNGTVIAWGDNADGQTNVPGALSNAVAVAAGSKHSLALKSDGTVVAWGNNSSGQTNVPGTVTNATAIAAGGFQSLALLRNGTVVQWGLTNAAIPSGLTNVTAIASGTNFAIALLQNSTVVAWGTNAQGQTNIPAGLSNVVAIAAGGSHALALEQNGTVIAWGSSTNVPAGLSNVMAIAAGDAHTVALKNDGTVVTWGDDSQAQTNMPGGMTNLKLVAAGGNHSLAAVFSTFVQYPVDVTKDLLLIYNTNSADSATVLNYYLAHRPMVSGAAVLPISYTNSGNYETISPTDFTNIILTPVTNWLVANPTKRPQYVILFLDIPSRVNTDTVFESYGSALPSVSVQLATSVAEWQPFVTHINMGATNTMNHTNDCINYINKVATFGSNYAPGQLIISASAAGYANTNYYFDDGNNLYTLTLGLNAMNGVIQNGASTNSVTYADNDTNGLSGHITNGSNVAGYLCWGGHSALGPNYAVNGEVHWSGNSSWYIVRTVESFNGRWYEPDMGNFMEWYSGGAFGSTNYFNTPVGTVSYVDEPTAFGTLDSLYFGLWQGGKIFSSCVWNSRNTPYFQAVGDPFVRK